MSPKSLLSNRILFLKIPVLLFFLISIKMSSQTAITTIHTDWNTYWKSSGKTLLGNRPDTENNLLAFEWNGKTYSTGVNDNMLTTKTVVYIPQKFRALKVLTLGLDSGMYILQGSMIDGLPSTAVLKPAKAGTTITGAELASRLTDGINGLSLGTGVANIKKGTAEFKVGTNNLNLDGLGDGVPDLIVSQVAEPGGTADVFQFVDKFNNIVGHSISINFGSMNAVGTYSLDLFKADGGTNPFSPADTRDIRMLGIETSDFGITSTNAADVDRFVVNFSGNSDCAFIAFNTNSLKIAELSLVTKSNVAYCGKAGDIINYTYEITNTGQVPITDIKVSDALTGVTVSGNPVASLAVGEKTTLTGTYTITATDVSVGQVVNTAKVSGTDPSLNTVEDTNSPTTTVLLATPTIVTYTNRTCSTLGTISLSNLPSGNWTLERYPGPVNTTGSGTSITLNNIPVGNYTYKVSTPEGCKSPASAVVNITDQSTTTWNGTTWSHGDPDATKNTVFAAAFTITKDYDFCSCTINSGVDIVVPSGFTLNITNGVTVTSTGSLTFQNNASLVQTNTSSSINSGNISYNRTINVRRYDWTYWSSPVKRTSPGPFTLYDLSSGTLADKYNSYDAANDKWTYYLNGAQEMFATVGYTVRAPQSFSITAFSNYTATFIGVPNNGSYTVNPVSAKWNLIGNPYPSAIDADSFITINHNATPSTDVGALYLWTHATAPIATIPGTGASYSSNDYITYTLTGGTGTSGKIAAGQSFFMYASGPNPVRFTNAMRIVGNNSQFYKTAKTNNLEKNRLWLNLTNTDGAFKQLLVGYIEGATNNWDINYDATTMDGNSYVDFYSINSADKMTIQGRALPFDDTDRIPLGYKTVIAGDFTISIDHADGFFDNQIVYLEDKLTGKVQDLTAGDFTFSTEIGTFTDRFTISYVKKTLGTGDFENVLDDVLVSVKNKVIKVNTTNENIREVAIYDISGRLLYNKKKLGLNEFQITNLQSANQVLLVKVKLENDAVVTKKIIFQ